MKSINRETMLCILAKVLSTDTIILHYKELDTALNAYYFFRDEFYVKSNKVLEGKISLVEYSEHSQYFVCL